MKNKQSLSLEDQLRARGLDTITEEILGIKLPTKIDQELARFITIDPAMIAMKNKVRRLATTSINVLIIGETGVGKEIIAKALAAGRPAGNFVAVNTAGIPDSLLEAEFFGTKKGAYTGCNEDRLGYLREADNGSLFLDEIGDMPFLLQCKLLRAIQEGRARPIGGDKEYSFNCRLISATNHEHIGTKNNGNFRLDLFYRIAGSIIKITPLRDRVLDIYEIAKSYSYNPVCMELDKIWPGNTRELINYINESKALS